MGPQTKGALYGLTAALLSGVSAPIAKLFLSDVSPVLTWPACCMSVRGLAS
jgi:hypothetical protein